jgi:DNA-binding PadR family transcriptional regulator
MPGTSPTRPSPLALTVLLILGAGPSHPYEVQRRIKLFGKDQVVNVGQRANLYKTIDRLHEAGLISVRHTERDQRFPERTVYELTDEGLRIARDWLVEMLSVPRKEFPWFPAALSFVFTLPPDEALAMLQRRVDALRTNLAELDRGLAGELYPLPPRLFLLEVEYLRAVTAAELAWLDGVVHDLRTGALTWNREELMETAKPLMDRRLHWRAPCAVARLQPDTATIYETRPRRVADPARVGVKAAISGDPGVLSVSTRWLGSVKLQDGDIGSLWRWEADRGQHVFEVLVIPT